MPKSPQAQFSRRKKSHTRLVMISAAIGALLVLVVSATLNWPGDKGVPGFATGKEGASPAPAAVFNAKPGTCLDWSVPDARDIRSVLCEEPHLFEVAGKADLRADFGDRAPFPNTEQWQQLKQQKCTQVSGAFVRLDPAGRFSVGAFTPSEDGWSHGDRILHCGLQQPGPSGKLYRIVGNVGRLDQSNTYSVGRCLGINGTAVWDPVDCAQPHAVEVTGMVDLTSQFFNGPPPAETDQDKYLATKCTELTAQYAGSATTAQEKGLTTYWDTLPPESWGIGSRRVNCKLSAQLPDGSALAPVTGSVKGPVQVGKEPAPKDATHVQPGVPASGER